ncbi:MAG: agmatinase [Candidatus Rokubacteria bacterium]|nr:agmatinase [Candidatus Rokubacteria bacterium]
MPTFLPQDSLKTPRFCGITTFMRLPHTQALEGVDVAVVGIPFGTGSPFRVGCRFGPTAVRAMSLMLRPINPYQDLNVFEECGIVDYGDTDVAPGYLPESFERIEAALAPLAERGVIPVGVGGDHSITLPELRVLGKVHGPLAILHFDAHTDTWDTYFAGQKHSAGTAFRRGVEEGWIDARASMQVGMRGSLFTREDIQQSLDLGYEVVTTDEMLDGGIEVLARRIREKFRGRKVFLSFDLDVVDPAFAPGVQTPEAGGPTAREILRLLRTLRGLHLVGADVVEMNPNYDAGQITALLAATVAAEILALVAAWKRDRRMDQVSGPRRGAGADA